MCSQFTEDTIIVKEGSAWPLIRHVLICSYFTYTYLLLNNQVNATRNEHSYCIKGSGSKIQDDGTDLKDYVGVMPRIEEHDAILALGLERVFALITELGLQHSPSLQLSC